MQKRKINNLELKRSHLHSLWLKIFGQHGKCAVLTDASLLEMKNSLYCTNCIVTYFTKILSPNTGILIPSVFSQHMKNLVFSFGVDLYLCLGIVSFKIESSNQEISLQRKGGRIYHNALHTVRIIYQNRNIY